MTTRTYDKNLPDQNDRINHTGTHPGFNLVLRVKQGDISLHLGRSSVDLNTGSTYAAFLNLPDAEELLTALQTTILRARAEGAQEGSLAGTQPLYG